VEYVEHFFAIKAEADVMLAKLSANHKDFGYWTARRLFAKIFLNALYGKFASNPENYAEFMTIPAERLQSANELEGWDFCKLLSQETAVVTRPLPEEKHRFYDVAVAASITGFVRAYLWRAIKGCKGVLYCDTDSIACEDTGEIQIGSKLGDWEIEADCDQAAIAGKKLYAFRRAPGSYNPAKAKPYKTASKGVRLEAEEIIEIAAGRERLYIPEVPTFSIRKDPIFTPRKIRKR
jgi:DNA polymerase elongation subunit (family B)